MTRYGFLIDQDTCIGCHACTVACKAEHDVPLGVNRTWVKYIESGSFPDVSRHFAVMRCNHCDNAPCVTICPTGALFHRDNGIVDFDTASCIGCKSCMNACPYDALYIDPSDHTAQKCNFCAHRVEVGLQPSCVVVCPTQSIVAGDLDDPTSKISQMISTHDVSVRAPEQGTKPKLFYKGADPAALDPMRAAIAADGMVWAETTPGHPTMPAVGDNVSARTTYTTAHPTPWGWPVTAYLATKAIAAGALLIGALYVALGHAGATGAIGVMPAVVAGVFTALTAVLLVGDLKQPRRFLFLLTRPNWSSWLVRGAVVLGVYTLVTAAWFVAGLAGSERALQVLAVPSALAAAAAAGYTAFLFAQCEGRDLWQTPLLLPDLLAQAVIAGAAAFGLADLALDIPQPDVFRWALIAGLLTHLVVLAAEVLNDSTDQAAVAMRVMVRGREAPLFWAGVAGAGVAIALAAFALASVSSLTLTTIASIMALSAIVLSEAAFIRAGQAVPLS
jgi:Fe-S-cluster-containing dehydrogenase component/formate-dependent nitrite reductase membrane component NrfD